MQINNALNHKLRRFYEKDGLKQDVVTDLDSNGKIVSDTRYRIENRKKANNTKYWLDSVNDNIKKGKGIERFNREYVYNEELKRQDERNASLLRNLVELYGMDEGNLIYNEELKRQEKRKEKKKKKK